VARHGIYVVCAALPDARHASHPGLTAQLALGADLAGDAGDLVGEGRELVDHGVEGVLELQDLALGVDGDLLGQVALGHRRRDRGDLAHLRGQVVRHRVDVVGEVLPDPGHAPHLGLAAELALGAGPAGHPGDLGGERGQLVDHRVHGRLELQDLALRVDVDLAGEVAVGDRGRHLRDVADLVREVPRHGVDVVGEVLPDPGHALHLGPAAQL